MGVIDTMITVAPLLGIFGTVLGIITSFDVPGTTGIKHPEEAKAGVSRRVLVWRMSPYER